MNKTTLSKIFSTSLSLAMVVSSAPVPAGALGPVDAAAPAFVSRLTPPERFGYVASSFAPQGESAPRMIIISDLHGHVEVQKNIVSLLDSLIGKLTTGSSAQSRVPIFVEGGWAPNLGEPLRFVKDQNTRSFLREYLMRKSEIGAAQAYSELQAGTGKVTLTGVEDKAIYEANKRQFARTYPVRKAVLLALARREEALRALSQQVEPGAFQKLQGMRDDYYKGKVAPERYARKLVSLADRFHVNGPSVEILRNFASASSSASEVALVKTYRAVAVKLSEKKPLSSYLRESLDREDVIRKNVARMDSMMDLLKRLVSNQLTPEEVPMALANMSQLVWIAQQLLQDEKLALDVEKVVRQSLDFYPFALLRDRILAANSVAALNADSTKAPTGILIVGGFHTQAVDDYLRQQKIAYLDLRPNVTRDLSAREQLNYVKRLCGEHVTPGEIKNDIANLKKAMTGRTEAAIGQALSLQTDVQTPEQIKGETGPNPEDLGMSGIGQEAAKVMDATIFNTRDQAVDYLQSGGDIAAVKGAVLVLGAVQADAAVRMDNVIRKAENIGWNVSLDQSRSATLTRQGDGFVTQGTGIASRAAEMATAIYNTVSQMSAGQKLPTLSEVENMDVQVITEAMRKAYVEKMATGEIQDGVVTDDALIAGVNSGRPVIFITEEALTKTGYAFAHEATHAFDKNAQPQKMATPEEQKAAKAVAEKVAVINGLVFDAAFQQALDAGTPIGAINATTKVSIAALQAAWERNKARIPEGEFHTKLANAIANLMNPVGVSDPTVQQLINELRAQFPEVSDYTLQKDVKEWLDSPVLQMEGVKGDDGNIDPKKVEPLKEKVAGDAKQQGATGDEA